MKNKFILSALIILSLSACTAGDFRKAVGVERESPDEFMVKPRAKLKIPDQAIALPAPQKKVDDYLLARDSGREALYGESNKNKQPVSAGEMAFLEKTKAKDSSPEVRRQVEQEYKSKTGVFGTERGGALEAILDPFGYNKPVDPVVDAKAENKRIREAIMKGEKIEAEKVKSYNPAKETAKKSGVL